MSEPVEPTMSSLPFEEYPLTRTEYISAMVHFYRGELSRAVTWRVRLDTSTNWAIISVIGILTWAFGSPEHSHFSIIMGMLFLVHFLTLEAKRFRIFDVWRNRVRMIEENFYGPLLTRDLRSPKQEWASLVARDLVDPRFKMSYLQALRKRFISNYAVIFGLLLAAWVAKLLVHPESEGFQRLGVGPVEWYIPVAIVVALYASLLALVAFVPRIRTVGHGPWTASEHDQPTAF